MTLQQSVFQPSSQPSLRKLMASFGKKMRQIRRLNLKIDRASTRLEAKPKLRLKMDSWLMQLGLLKTKEDKALALIKTIETRHMKMRLKKQLKVAQSLDPMRNGPEPSSNSNKRRARMMMIYLFFIYMLFRSRKMKPSFFSALTNG